ncbi:MAG: hypothetical protein AB1411_02370 [Nitrospirota bacterium]
MVEEIKGAALQLTADLASWRLARVMVGAAEAGEAEPLRVAVQQADRQEPWLFARGARSSLRRAWRLSDVLVAIPPAPEAGTDVPSSYGEYAARMDRAYARLVETEDSWLSVAEREGATGIRRRLLESEAAGSLSGSDRETFASRYFSARLRPVVTAHMVALALRAEADAELAVTGAWTLLHRWKDRLQEVKGLARLCGTWQWTVHNHQNHQDHKMMLSFPPPGATEAAGPRPSKVVILGDTVYLRWEFQGGVQEDSLLFGSGGQRLEGTFVNSAGAWGSITGKRTAPCQKERMK